MRARPVACALAALAFAPLGAAGAPVLRSAEARLVFTSPTTCHVDLTLRVEDGAPPPSGAPPSGAPGFQPRREIEHRIEAADGSRIELLGVYGAEKAREPADVGRTRALVLRPEASVYTVRYTVDQPSHRATRCPLWIPTVPTDGRSQAVRLLARLPAGATAVGTMPTFAWTGEEGVATLGHLPSFVRVPYALPGAPAPWNIARAMDVVSVATLVLATLAWARRRRRGQAPESRP